MNVHMERCSMSCHACLLQFIAISMIINYKRPAERGNPTCWTLAHLARLSVLTSFILPVTRRTKLEGPQNSS